MHVEMQNVQQLRKTSTNNNNDQWSNEILAAIQEQQQRKKKKKKWKQTKIERMETWHVAAKHHLKESAHCICAAILRLLFHPMLRRHLLTKTMKINFAIYHFQFEFS